MIARTLRRVGAAAAIALFAILLGGQGGYAQAVSTVLSQKAPEANEMASIADRRGHVRVIVKFASLVSPSQLALDPAALAAAKQQIATTQNAIITTHFGSAANPAPGRGFARGVVRFDITPAFAVNVTLAELEVLAADPRVEYIQYDRAVPPTLIDSVPLIGMTVAYSLGATGQGQAVAILDTGVQSNHEFLTGKVVSEACFSNSGGGGGQTTLCPNGLSSQTGAGAANSETAQCIDGSTELCVHGTHVAGIAAGKNTSQGGGEPPNGVAKEAQLVAVQIFTRFNSAGDCGSNPAPCVLTYSSDQISALNWVLQNAVNLPGGVKTAAINMSIGGGYFTSACDGDSRKSIIDSLKAAGVATAIAAGNDSFTDGVGAPGCISTAITVGSSTKADGISSFSNMSAGVDLMAPGSSIQSSVAVVPHSTSTYQFFNGTSMATPHVAGTFAAIRTVCPAKTVDQIEAALKSTGTSIVDNRPACPGGAGCPAGLTRPAGSQTKPRIRVDLAVQQLNCSAGGPALVVSPSNNVVASGNQGGPFAPISFSYDLTATGGNVNFSVTTDQPTVFSSITPSSGTTPATVTFTLNQATLAALAPGSYGATLSFTNTTNGQGNTTRTATAVVTPAGPTSNDNFVNAATINLNQTKTANNATATKEAGEPSHAGNAGGRSLWWNFQAVTSGPVRVTTGGSNFDTLLGVYIGNAVNSLSLVASNDDENNPSILTSLLTFNAVAGTVYRIAVDGFNGASGNIQLGVFDNSTPGATFIVAAVAPNARTTAVNGTVTAFATIINGGGISATSCSIALPGGFPATFLYQTTDPGTNQPTGSPNVPVNIGAGAAQSFYFAVTPTQILSHDIPIVFDCTNTNPATVVPGLNTFLLSSGASAIPDMLSIADTLSHDGKMNISGASGTGLIVTAAINIGAAGTVTFTPVDTPYGQLPRKLPLSLTICQTNPSGQCINPATPGSSSTVTVANNQTVTFSIFAAGQGTLIPYDPANNRVFILGKQGNTPVGEASAAVNMQ